ncbi:hypothetical protein HK096_007862, partial [Nowakowskiella sp. JEL0078]
SYPFQKALALTGDRTWMKIVAYSGFIPLVFYKIGIIIFRYFWIFRAESSSAYFILFNQLDAGSILVTAWNDVLCCFIIVYVGWDSHSRRRKKKSNDDFIYTLVSTTELRIVICTALSVISAAVIFAETCKEDSIGNTCQFTNARNIAIDVVYGLYYLDYLVIKLFGIQKGQKTIAAYARKPMSSSRIPVTLQEDEIDDLSPNISRPSIGEYGKQRVQIPTSAATLKKGMNSDHESDVNQYTWQQSTVWYDSNKTFVPLSTL